MKEFRLVARGRGWFCNLPFSRLEKTGAVITVWNGEEWIGQFDLGSLCIDVIYQSEVSEKIEKA